MNQQTQSTPLESDDSMCLAYGREVKELLEMSTPAEMAEHLWEVYSGFVLFEKEAGYNPRQTDIFLTFRELVHFCQRIERMSFAG
jgi:hypothetical protein